LFHVPDLKLPSLLLELKSELQGFEVYQNSDTSRVDRATPISDNKVQVSFLTGLVWVKILCAKMIINLLSFLSQVLTIFLLYAASRDMSSFMISHPS
jgi:hypothetical protein